MIKQRFSIRLWLGWMALMMGLLVTVSAVSAQAVSPTEAMTAGNQSYEAGNYAQAVEIYETMVAAGIQDSTLYYNLGNAYFKQGQLGKAILNYRRAYRLDPRDVDNNVNLALARSQALDKLDTANDGAVTNFVKAAEDWLTLDEASMLALGLWLLLCGLAIVAILLPRFRQVSLWAMAVVGLFLIVGLISIANRLYNDYAYPPAVVVAEQVSVMSGPGGADQYVVEFDLHTGAEVTQLESHDNWRRVSLPGHDFQGWVSADALELVNLN
ncbi:MAG: tetratricopeptide repeat protein [Anaerolineae bacterium]|nr:tetratricopeptide repeat protein [Anaerolineae bacterium]MCB9103102.1 tetratricopeptide repeat protein [Anaerolineales bacterium]